MAEYIDRDAVLSDIEAAINNNGMGCVVGKTMMRYLKRQPAADVEEVKHGRWILGHVEPGYFTPGGNRPWVCSECGQVVSWRLDKPKENFCHNCGAKMNGGEENGRIH